MLRETQNRSRAGFGLLNLEKGIAKKMAKRNEGQAIENNRFREIPVSAPSMISMTCGARCETFGFVWRNESFRFRDFWPRQRKKRNGRCAPGRRL
jgi:hypothetical protein